jgi:hypothetical protein
MTAPEVQWALDQLGSVVGAITTPLKRVNRDESRILEGDVRSRTGELRAANFVGVTLADRASAVIGTRYDHRVETTLGLRIEGLHYGEHGHVDDSGAEGISWTTASRQGLVDRCRDAILEARTFPDAGDAATTYTTVIQSDETPLSSNYADAYRRDLEFRLEGFEELP